MNEKVLAIVVMALLCSNTAHSASIYKCSKQGKTVMFSDKPCPNMDVKLIHAETALEMKRQALEENIATIKRLISNNQVDAAKEVALKNNLAELYRKQLLIHANQKVETEKQTAEFEKQQQLNVQQQALLLQQQQLELQKQQIAIEKSKAEQQQQLINNQTYYSYPRFSHPHQYSCQPPHCVPTPQLPRTPVQLPSGGMNPPPSTASKMNPP